MIQVEAAPFPTPLSAYPPAASDGLLATLAGRVAHDPFNLVVTAIFAAAILHTFTAARFTRLAHAVQRRHDARNQTSGGPATPTVVAELLHFLGEVEVMFGLWAVALVGAIAVTRGWVQARDYVGHTVDYTEPLFVVVIMALASTRPIITQAERSLRAVARLGGATPAAWWVVILTIAPLMGSFITEPAAMTIAAVLLGRQFYDLDPSPRLKYATLGLLFVNVSLGGTLTHFAAPPVLMVARHWNWDTAYVASHVGWRAVAAIGVSTAVYFAIFRTELLALSRRPPVTQPEKPEDDIAGVAVPRLLPVPAWITAVHVLFIVWTVVNSHYPVLFIGGFLFFLGFVRATAAFQSRVELRTPLLVGFFLGGLVIHGGLQAWWIAPVLASLSEHKLYLASTILTAFNDNALITYLATLVPDLEEHFKIAVVQGAVTGGGLTVIANAPNPAGQALLSPFFRGAVAPLALMAGALLPTLIAILAFRL